MIKTKVAFVEGRFFSGQSGLLDKSRPSKKATFVLIM